MSKFDIDFSSRMLFIIYKKIFNTKTRKAITYIILKKEGGYFESPTIRKIYRELFNIEIGYGTYGGAFSLEKIATGTRFGNYCSIGWNVYILNGNHPKRYFTLHPLLYNPRLGYVKKDLLRRTRLVVGHDVWIGLNAIILPSVTKIGNGAIIGAGAILSKDVEPYTIVAGNPARVINKRFNPEIIEKLEQSRWWELKKEDLLAKREYFEALTNFSLESLN